MPADAAEGEYGPDRTLYDILWGDGQWHPVTIRAWRKDVHDRQVIDVEFHAEASTWSESYLYDQTKVRDLGE